MLFVSLVLIQLLIFGALAVLLRYVLTRNISQAQGHLQKLTQDCTEKLDEAKKRKEEADRYYQDVLNKAKEEGERLKHELIQEGTKAKEEMLEMARQQGDEIVRRAQTAADLLRQEMDEKIEEQTIEKTRQILLELLPGKISEETHSYWVTELIKKGFEDLSRLHVSEHTREAQVVSAFPLKPNEKTLLRDHLNRKLGRPIQLREEVDPELILGLRVTLDSLVIDGTLQFRIRETLRHAQSQNATRR